TAGGTMFSLPYGSATERMSKELYSAGEIRARHKKVLERLAGIPTFELQYCSLDQAIERLERLAAGL
ncbi:MAG: aldolase, partial [Edaphobacter sp.]